MSSKIEIKEKNLESIEWCQIKQLVDHCYPSPPRDVFDKMLNGTLKRRRIWIATDNSTLIGFVMLSVHSKGGHLENLSVASNYRSQGIGSKLVEKLLHESHRSGGSIVTLTTRIPSYFASHGFRQCDKLDDGSIFMYRIY